MTVLYIDSSALLKRVIAEAESPAIAALLRSANASGDLLTASSIAWVEVWRSLRRAGVTRLQSTAQRAMSGIAELPMSDSVLMTARTIGDGSLRALDAIHLAAAIAVAADSVVTYDQRLAASADSIGMNVVVPT